MKHESNNEKTENTHFLSEYELKRVDIFMLIAIG